MTPLIEKYINSEKIKAIVKEKNFNEIIYGEFIEYIDNLLQEAERYGFEEGYEQDFLEDASNYISEIENQIKKGFSIEWAKEFTYNNLLEEDEDSPALAYDKILKTNPIQALNDLKLYSRLTNRDYLFVRHFVHLIEVDVPNVTPSVEQQSIVYSEIYKEQIKAGKSDLFANRYSKLIARETYEPFCYAEAAEYEKAISAGYSETYANLFASAMGDYIGDRCASYEESIDDELACEERVRLEILFEYLK